MRRRRYVTGAKRVMMAILGASAALCFVLAGVPSRSIGCSTIGGPEPLGWEVGCWGGCLFVHGMWRRDEDPAALPKSLVDARYGGAELFVADWPRRTIADVSAWTVATVGPHREVQVALPLWALAVVLGLIPVVSLLRWRVRSRVQQWRTIRGRCLSCGYNLTGNTTGICPECGTTIDRAFDAEPEEQQRRGDGA
jgi:hypothetical protein